MDWTLIFPISMLVLMIAVLLFSDGFWRFFLGKPPWTPQDRKSRVVGIICCYNPKEEVSELFALMNGGTVYRATATDRTWKFWADINP